jgi:hypothetical protein
MQEHASCKRGRDTRKRVSSRWLGQLGPVNLTSGLGFRQSRSAPLDEVPPLAGEDLRISRLDNSHARAAVVRNDVQGNLPLDRAGDVRVSKGVERPFLIQSGALQRKSHAALLMGPVPAGSVTPP